MVFNNISVIKYQKWSPQKQCIDLDVRIAPHCAFLNTHRKVVLFYRDPSGNYLTINPDLYDVEWKVAEDKVAFSDRVHNIKITKSQLAKTGNTRHHYDGYTWLFDQSPVDVAIFQHYGHVEAADSRMNTYHYILEKNTEIYMLRNDKGLAVQGHMRECLKYSEWSSYKPKKKGFTKRNKYHADGSVTTETLYNGKLVGEIIYDGYEDEDIQDEETLYKGEETELEKMCRVAEESGRKESGIDFLYKGDTSIKLPDVATLTIKIPTKDIAEVINMLRANGVKDIHLQL